MLNCLYTTFMSIVLFVLILMPRETFRAFRHCLSQKNMWLWKKTSLIHAHINDWLWQRGNGP